METSEKEMLTTALTKAAFIAPVCSIGTREQLAKLYCALAKAQGEFETITKNRVGFVEYRDSDGFLQTKEMRYADLEEITAKTRPALSRHGLATIQPISHAKHGGGMAIFTQLIHEDGGMLMSEIPLSIEATRMKDSGAAITYLRRYAKGALLDVSADDDLDETPGALGGVEPEATTPRAGQVTRQPAEQAPAKSSDYYADEKFQTNLVGWIAAMRKGRTADQIIKTATTRLKLTDEQIQTIRDNEPTDNEKGE